MNDALMFVMLSGIIDLLAVALISFYVKKQKEGTKKMKEISSYIRKGAKAFLRRETITISYFIILFSLILGYLLGWQIGVGFFVGSYLSLLAAYIGMNIATLANVRTTEACRVSVKRGLKIAFLGGSVTGLSIVGMSILGISILYIVFGDPRMLVGFGFGATLAALFAQLGGGIYTKAADIGADLVGKVEEKIPEDDPRNPAVIADLVGDNVGDCAGRGSDLYSSFSDNIVGIMILGLGFLSVYGTKGILFPLLIESAGIIATLVGITFILKEWKSPFLAINLPLIVTTLLSIVAFYFISVYYMNDINLFYCSILGVATSVIISLLTQYYTGIKFRPVKEIAESAQSGAAINVLSGLSYGMESAFLPTLVISAVIVASYLISGIYGIAAATLGILATTGIIMSSDTFGPIADNADGIAEMAKVKTKGTELLDAIGNMTKAITKGYAMSCALLSGVVLLYAYFLEANLTAIDLSRPLVLAGAFIGASVPFLFSSFALKAVNRSAFKIVEEVRRQFREIKGLLRGKAKPEYDKCVDITTKEALKGMMLPTLISIAFPTAVGFILGVAPLAAYLVGSTIVSALLAYSMFNAGGALDNAKKYVEDGHFGGKGTETHAASVVGDTVGDPLKDTAGPSLHILIKLQSIIALTLLPLFIKYALI